LPLPDTILKHAKNIVVISHSADLVSVTRIRVLRKVIVNQSLGNLTLECGYEAGRTLQQKVWMFVLIPIGEKWLQFFRECKLKFYLLATAINDISSRRI
jgi:hypothetical protein